MRSALALYKKELATYFYSLLSYLFIIVFVVVLAWLFWQNAFLVNQVTMREWFTLLPWFFLFLLPALSMRQWSEEKKQGTIETVLTLPLSDTQAVAAKFLAAVSFLVVVLLCSLPLPITLSRLGNLDLGPVLGSYLGAVLLGASYLALGQLLSALTKNQIVAFLITIAIAFLLLVLGLPGMVSGASWLARLAYVLSTQTHFVNLAKGVIDLRDVVYYVSLASLCLYLNVVVLRRRHVSVLRSARWLFVVGSMVLFNVVIMGFSLRADLTQDQQYTLSGSSKTLVQNVTDLITLKLFFSSEVPQNLLAVRQDVIDILQEYKQAGNGHVVVEVVDPKEDSDAQAEAESYGISQIQFNVLEKESFAVSKGYVGLAIIYGDKHDSLPVISDTTTFEYDVSAAIYKLTRDTTPEIAWLSDHGVINTSVLQQYVGQQYTVTPVTLDDLATTTAKTLVIAGPTKEFFDTEQYAVDQYLMKGNRVVVLYDGQSVNTQFLAATPNSTGLETLLKKYGVTVNQDMVADFASSATVPFGSGAFTVYRSYVLWPLIQADGFTQDNPITAKLQALTLPWPSSLTLAPADGETITILAQTSAQSYSYAQVPSLNPDDLVPPDQSSLQAYPVAAWVHGTMKSVYTADALPAGVDASQFVASTDQGQIIVVGSAQFVVDDFLSGSVENGLIVVNAIDALSQDSTLSSIRSRQALNQPMKYLTDTQKVVVKYTNIFSGVVVVLLLAGGSFMVRRRRDRKAQQHYA